MENELLLLMRQIKAQLDGISKLEERISRLEHWQSWLRGGWTALAGAWAYVWSGSCGK